MNKYTKAYNKGGIQAVFFLADKNKLPYHVCDECNIETPTYLKACAVCGTLRAKPITLTKEELDIKLLQREYRTLSQLWEPKSVHKTHLLISSEMTRVLNEIAVLKGSLEGVSIPKAFALTTKK